MLEIALMHLSLNARNSLNAFITSTSTNTLDFETLLTGSGATFTAGTLTTINGITFSTNATLTGGSPANGITSASDTAATGFGTTASNGSGTFIRLDPADNQTFTFKFDAPVSQFGFIITDFGNTPTPGNNPLNTASFVISDSLFAPLTVTSGITQITNASVAIDSNSRNARFFGVSSDNGTAIISRAVFTIDRPSTGLERFGLDDFRVNTQPIPFDFNAAPGLIFVGGYFGFRSYLKRKVKKS